MKTMAMTLAILGAFLEAEAVACNAASKQDGKVNVTVFYEVLCPDSKHFLLRQLLPTWQKVPEIMTLDLRPFGKATYHKRSEGEGYTFSCQHGPRECLGNLVHNCAIRHVKNFFPYIACMMEDNFKPLQIGKNCAEQLNIDWEPIRNCAETTEGENIMAVVASTTLAVKHELSFIPTVALDGSFDSQRLMLKNFLPQVCQAYKGKKPEKCVKVD